MSQRRREVRKDVLNRMELENRTIEGDSPVGKKKVSSPLTRPSSTEHVKLGVNLDRPLSKAKYDSATDSEPVARANGEKDPCEGSEIEPETTDLQTVGGL